MQLEGFHEGEVDDHLRVVRVASEARGTLGEEVAHGVVVVLVHGMRTTLVDLVSDIDELAFGLAGAAGTDGGGGRERESVRKVEMNNGESMR